MTKPDFKLVADRLVLGEHDVGGWSRAIQKALEEAYAAGLERAAEVAKEQQQAFLDPHYAYPQPMGSIIERLACGQVADAIRAEKENTP